MRNLLVTALLIMGTVGWLCCSLLEPGLLLGLVAWTVLLAVVLGFLGYRDPVSTGGWRVGSTLRDEDGNELLVTGYYCARDWWILRNITTGQTTYRTTGEIIDAGLR